MKSRMTIRILVVCSIALLVLRIGLKPAYAHGGDLDLTFANSGIFNAAWFIGEKGFEAKGVAVQPDGKILVAGSLTTGNPIHESFLLIRLDDKGKLDPTFGYGGLVATSIKLKRNLDIRRKDQGGKEEDGDPSEKSVPAAIVIQPDGNDFRIVVAGTYTSGYGTTAVKSVFALARYDKAGQLEKIYSTDLAAPMTPTSLFGGSSVRLTSVLIQPNNNWIVAAGYTDSTNQPARFALARFDLNLMPDPGFGGGAGWVATPFRNGSVVVSARPYGVAFLRDTSMIVAAGEIELENSSGLSSSGPTTVALAGYDYGGKLDSTFGDGGQIISNILIRTNPRDRAAAKAIAIQNGKVVVAGSYTESSTGRSSFLLVRYDAVHKTPVTSPHTDAIWLDPKWTGGVLKTSFLNMNAWGNALAIQPDGYILVAGKVSYDLTPGRYPYPEVFGSLPFGGSAFGLARYKPDGAYDYAQKPDETGPIGFGKSGSIDYTKNPPLYPYYPAYVGTSSKVVTEKYLEGSWAKAIAIQPDGKIVLAGGSDSGSSNRFMVTRYLEK